MRTLDTYYSNIRTKSKNPNLDTDVIKVYLNDAVREMKSDYRTPSAIRRETIRVYTDVNEYAMPIPSGATKTDFESIVDMTEWFEGKTSLSRFNRTTPARFARKMNKGYQDDYITQYIRNTQNMLLVDYDPGTSNILLNSCDDLTTNGTWAATGDANNLTADDATYLEGGGCLNFDLTPSALAGYITNSTMAEVDLSDYENNSRIFCYVYIPVATYITGFTMKWGSSASAYFSKAITTQHNGLAFQAGWNLLSFDWNSATEAGTVDTTAIDYLQLTMSFSATQAADTDFRLDGITCKQGMDMYFIYNSKSWVESSAGVRQEEFEEATDVFVGTETEATALEWKATELIHTFEIIDDIKSDKAEKKYEKMIRSFKSQNPEQEKSKSFCWTSRGVS